MTTHNIRLDNMRGKNARAPVSLGVVCKSIGDQSILKLKLVLDNDISIDTIRVWPKLMKL